jgi:hypothetical protein
MTAMRAPMPISIRSSRQHRMQLTPRQLHCRLLLLLLLRGIRSRTWRAWRLRPRRLRRCQRRRRRPSIRLEAAVARILSLQPLLLLHPSAVAIRLLLAATAMRRRRL